MRKAVAGQLDFGRVSCRAVIRGRRQNWTTAGLIRQKGQLDPARKSELPKDGRQVRLHGVLGYHETACDFLIVDALANEQDNLAFAGGQAPESGLVAGRVFRSKPGESGQFADQVRD